MLTFLKVLLHLLYFAGVAVIEFALWSWLMPLLGAGTTIVILIIVFVILMMIYSALFWKWVPNIGELFDGMGDLFS